MSVPAAEGDGHRHPLAQRIIRIGDDNTQAIDEVSP
jgi:hypothetical protein